MLTLMDPDVARQLINSCTDVITPAAAAEAERYSKLKCPVCYQGGCVKVLTPVRIVQTPEGHSIISSPFGDSVIPQGHAHCIHCETNFDPDTGIILNSPASMISPP